MVSANVLYMIWEQIVFQEKRIFLFTPAREEQGWVGGNEGVPMGTELPWALRRTRWVMPPSLKHLAQGAYGAFMSSMSNPPNSTHSSVVPCFIPPGFSSQNRRQGMNGRAVCLVLQGETGSKGLHSRGRNTSHLRMATGHQQGHKRMGRMRKDC